MWVWRFFAPRLKLGCGKATGSHHCIAAVLQMPGSLCMSSLTTMLPFTACFPSLGCFPLMSAWNGNLKIWLRCTCKQTFYCSRPAPHFLWFLGKSMAKLFGGEVSNTKVDILQRKDLKIHSKFEYEHGTPYHIHIYHINVYIYIYMYK